MRLLPFVVALVLCGAAHAQSATELLLFGGNCNQASVSAGLVGRWLACDGASVAGTVARDLSGFGNSGTLVNAPTVVAGQVGQGLSFVRGSTQSVTASATPLPSGSNASTVTGWFNPSSCGVGGNGTAALMWGSESLNAGRFVLPCDADLSNHVAMGFFSNNVDSGTSITLNAPHFIAFVYNGGTSVTFCIDGGAAINKSLPSGTPNTSGSGFKIGALLASGYSYAGWQNDIRIYNFAMSCDAAATIRAAGLSGRASNDNYRGLEVLDRGLIAANDTHPLLDQLLTPMRRRPL